MQSWLFPILSVQAWSFPILSAQAEVLGLIVAGRLLSRPSHDLVTSAPHPLDSSNRLEDFVSTVSMAAPINSKWALDSCAVVWTCWQTAGALNGKLSETLASPLELERSSSDRYTQG
mmetsp:Transcript_139550/g.446553  ORF Transcript_139550/g.446553 Transcript_139550/m.446553 type:complete len:117 (-) Transcript_139550:32-382(-)